MSLVFRTTEEIFCAPYYKVLQVPTVKTGGEVYTPVQPDMPLLEFRFRILSMDHKCLADHTEEILKPEPPSKEMGFLKVETACEPSTLRESAGLLSRQGLFIPQTPSEGRFCLCGSHNQALFVDFGAQSSKPFGSIVYASKAHANHAACLHRKSSWLILQWIYTDGPGIDRLFDLKPKALNTKNLNPKNLNPGNLMPKT